VDCYNHFSGWKLAKLAILGLTISFSGVCVIFYDHLSDFLQPDFRFGILLSFIATISWAFGSLYTKKKAATFNPYFSLGLQMLISSLILLLTGATGRWTILITRWAFTDLIFATLIIGSMRVIFNTCLRRLRRPLRLRSNKISDQDSGVIWTLERAPDGRICCGWTLAFLSRWRSIDENRRCGKSRPLGGQVRFSPDALGSKTQSRWDRASSEPQPRGAFLLPVFNRSWT
jgi:hypothetical protein